MTDNIGIATSSIERARRYAELYPHLARKIMGQPPVYAAKPVPAPVPVPRPPVIRRLPKECVRSVSAWKAADEKAALLAEEFSATKTCPPRVGEIMKVVADIAGISLAEIRGKARPRKIAFPRHVAQFITSQLRPDLSFPKIAFLFGNKDHTSPYYAVQVVPRRIRVNPGLAAIYDKAMEALSNNHKEAA